jgi:hypothetical protein
LGLFVQTLFSHRLTPIGTDYLFSGQIQVKTDVIHHEMHEKDTDLILDGIQDKMDIIHHEETKKHEVEKELGGFMRRRFPVLLLAGRGSLVFKGRGFRLIID